MFGLRLFAIPIIVLTMVLVSGCTALGQAEQVQPEQVQTPRSDELSAVFSGYHADYNVAESPKELAQNAELVLQGEVVAVQKGREQQSAAGGVPTKTIVVVIRPTEVAQGTMSSSSDGYAYIELLSPGGQGADVYEKVLPANTSVVAYLQLAWDGAQGEIDEIRLVEPNAGRPAGQELYMLISPQGFAVQYAQSKEIVWPLGDDVQIGAIEDTLPSGSIVGHP